MVYLVLVLVVIRKMDLKTKLQIFSFPITPIIPPTLLYLFKDNKRFLIDKSLLRILLIKYNIKKRSNILRKRNHRKYNIRKDNFNKFQWEKSCRVIFRKNANSGKTIFKLTKYDTESRICLCPEISFPRSISGGICR